MDHLTESTVSRRDRISFADLSLELQLRILHFCLVEPFAVVDPRHPSSSKFRGACTDHAHARLELCPSSAAAAAAAAATVPKQGGDGGGQQHGLTWQQSHRATIAVQWSFYDDRPTHPYRRGLVPGVLATNSTLHSWGLPMLYRQNTFLFTTPAALRCFLRHTPATISRKIERVTLLMEVPQQPAHVAKTTSTWYGGAGLPNNPQGPWYSRLWGAPGLVVDELMVGCRGPEGEVTSMLAKPLRRLTVNFLDWRETQAWAAAAAADGFDEATTVVVERRNGEIEILSQPVRFVQGAEPVRWMEKLRGGGWTAREVRVTGLKDLEGGEELVREMERVLTFEEA